MSAEVISLATAWRKLPAAVEMSGGAAIGSWPGPADGKAEEVEVLVRRRPQRWRYTQPCPAGATHWRPVA